MDFSSEQTKIINHRDNHALVSAGPGSGKTTTLIGFLISLLTEGLTDKDLLVLMFNKSAKEDFVRKLESKIPGQNIKLPEVRTFHSLAYSIVALLEHRGMMPVYKLNSSSKYMEKLAMDACIASIGREKFNNIQNKQSKVIDFFAQYISLVKANILCSPKEIYSDLGLGSEYDFFIDAFEQFEKIRHQKRLRFFDDLLYDLALLINKDEVVRQWLGNKKKYVIVDEYQDTNITQTIILKAIVGQTGYCIAVGDADQSLYEFRGAHPGIMTKGFDYDFPNADKYKLSYSFRYGKKSALLANSLILNNKDRFDQICISHDSNPDTKPVMLSSSNHGKTSLEIIERKLKMGYEISDICVLVRLFSQSVSVELSLLKAGYKVNVEGGVSSLNSREMDNIVTLLEICDGRIGNLSEEERGQKFESLLKFPHLGINADAMNNLVSQLAKAKGSYGRIISNFIQTGLKKFQLKKLGERGFLISGFEKQATSNSKIKAHALIKRYISETDLKDGLSYTSMTDQEYSESCDRLDAITDFIKVNDDMPCSVLDLISDFKAKINANNSSIDSIKITSIHRSKGLEWPIVIIPGLIDGKFPYEPKKSMTIGNHIEGERRLLYVGITRGIREVYLLTPESSAMKEYLEKGTNKSQLFSLGDEPSSFIFETDFFRLKECDFGEKKSDIKLISRYNNEKLVLED